MIKRIKVRNSDYYERDNKNCYVGTAVPGIIGLTLKKPGFCLQGPRLSGIILIVVGVYALKPQLLVGTVLNRVL